MPNLLVPTNRRLLVEPLAPGDEKTESGVLLPDGFNKTEDKYTRVKVISAASSCAEVFSSHITKDVIVEKSMIEEFYVAGTKFNLVLENYVLALVK